MFTKFESPLLTIRQGKEGTFVSWLKDLGLESFISHYRYPLPKLVEWGWLVPQNREELLGTDTKEERIEYYFHWQAYALIDVIRSAVRSYSIIEVEEENIRGSTMRIATRVKECKTIPNPIFSNRLSSEWDKRVEPMTWISHYRSFRNTLPLDDNQDLHEKGAKQLAEHLKINDEMLEQAIKNELLVLARNWLEANKEYCEWTLQAWQYLQEDIDFAVEWLCLLNGKNLEHYLYKWRYKPMAMQDTWAGLHEVLPYEFFECREYFLRYAPIYTEKWDKVILPNGEKLKQLVVSLQERNDSFNSFLYAFRQIHKHINPQKKGDIDFRVLRALDYFSLLAIRVETCLRYALQENGSLKLNNCLISSGKLKNSDKLKDLSKYIVEIARQRKVSTQVIKYFNDKEKSLTQLHNTPKDPIADIMAIKESQFNENETYQVQAFLCCSLARNYFAHHTYLNDKLMDNKEKYAAFMLTGILVTVLFLLDNP